ncbi:MAG: SMC-Scp complex subunit ScpB [Candidatus Poribacteria bacterium]|nr:SMC-Scp complex subunit ScpB [Candidatus Poribacteria bacterium]
MDQQTNIANLETPPGQLKSILEAILFVSSEPITIEQFCQVLEGVSPKRIKDELAKLAEEYQESGRSFQLTEIANGYQITTHPEYHDWVSKFHTKQVRVKLTPAALEALAIVAYKQPVTRADVEAVRGVNSDSVLNSLLEKGLIGISRRTPDSGRSFQFETTDQFLDQFGLKDLSDLPSAEEIQQFLLTN